MWNLVIIERDGRNTAILAHLFTIVFFLGSAYFTAFCYHVGLKNLASTDIGGKKHFIWHLRPIKGLCSLKNESKK